MSIVQNLGFRFFISGVKDSKYGIKDLEDLSTEFYSLEEVVKIAKEIKIKGVVDEVVKIDWFKSYILKEWTFRPSDAEFMKKFGLYLIRDGGELQIRLVVRRDTSDDTGNEEIDSSFIEFITSFKTVLSPKDRFVVCDSSSTLSCENFTDALRHVMQGVGFKYIRDPVLCNFPIDMLNTVEFDEYALKYNGLTVYVSAFLNKNYIKGLIKTKRRMHIFVSRGADLQLEKCTSYGGRLVITSYVTRLGVDESFFDSDIVGFRNCKFTTAMYVVSKYDLLLRLLESERESRFQSYGIGKLYEGSISEGLCCLIIADNEDIDYTDSIYDSFIFVNNSRPKIFMEHKTYNKVIREKDFERRHNISIKEFVSLVVVKE